MNTIVTETRAITYGRNKGGTREVTYRRIEGTVLAHRNQAIKNMSRELTTVLITDQANTYTIEVWDLRPRGSELPKVGEDIQFSIEVEPTNSVYYLTQDSPLYVVGKGRWSPELGTWVDNG